MTTLYSAFQNGRILRHGSIAEVALAIRESMAVDDTSEILTFDDVSGRVLDLNLQGTEADIAVRYGEQDTSEPRGRGRPKLGVVPREVTLLPRHWEWLAAQRGGASVALRRLVDEARKLEGDTRSTKERQEAAYRFMMAMAGNLPNLEEALRALFANDKPGFETLIAGWPEDIRGFALRLAFGD
jgi:uncharacterized protein